MTGLVYYVLDATRRVQYLKIGYTANLSSRVKELAGISTSRQPPLVLALEEGSLAIERERHEKFAELRSHGEWFRYVDPLKDFVAEMEHPFAYLLDRPYLWRWAGGWGPLGSQAAAQRPFDPSLALADDELPAASDPEIRF